jgi:hypothetical protein
MASFELNHLLKDSIPKYSLIWRYIKLQLEYISIGSEDTIQLIVFPPLGTMVGWWRVLSSTGDTEAR